MKMNKQSGQVIIGVALAFVVLAGFAGFVHEQLRMHDYQLGRRNCQKFLADHFHLHVDNPIVAPWVGRLADRGALDLYHPTLTGAAGKREKCRDLCR